MKVLRLILAALICVSIVSAVQDHPIELGKTTLRYEDVIQTQNSLISSTPSENTNPMIRKYSVDAGNWHVIFSIDRQMTTKVKWFESDTDLYKNDGYYVIDARDSFNPLKMVVINIYEGKTPQFNDRSSMIEGAKGVENNGFKFINADDYKIDGNNGIVYNAVFEQMDMTIIGALFPIDLSPESFFNSSVVITSSFNAPSTYLLLDSLHIDKTAWDSNNLTQPATPFAGPTSAYAGVGQGAKAGAEDKNIFNSVSPDAFPQSREVPAAQTENGPFVGSSKSDKYHYTGCSAAQRIKSENPVTFSRSEEARAAGYTPCGICNPP